jgi:RimJ/RimL family protein N-acetyltransferase
MVRRWRQDDAQALNQAVSDSREHLRPWMPWAQEDPPTLADRLTLFADWDREWRAGGDAFYGIFVAGAVAGGCGLHRRLGPAGLEIGYWLAASFTGRGVMTTAAALLTDAAFGVPGIELVEIHHDRTNERSGGVPRRLGYTLVGEFAREPQAPAETGLECRWRITREQWLGRGQG